MNKVIPLPDLEPPEDGLRIRDVGPWAREKLGILRNYYPALIEICSSKRRPVYCVDGLAGPGHNRVIVKRRHGQPPVDYGRVLGSPMVAVKMDPPFTSCLFMDRSPGNVKALQVRTGDDSRVHVRRGDVNNDLLPAMRDVLDPTSPGIVVLDPEGMEVHWSTIEEIAAFRPGDRRPEVLILFDSDALERMTPMYATDPHMEEVITRIRARSMEGDSRKEDRRATRYGGRPDRVREALCRRLPQPWIRIRADRPRRKCPWPWRPAEVHANLCHGREGRS